MTRLTEEQIAQLESDVLEKHKEANSQERHLELAKPHFDRLRNLGPGFAIGSNDDAAGRECVVCMGWFTPKVGPCLVYGDVTKPGASELVCDVCGNTFAPEVLEQVKVLSDLDG